MGEYITLDKLLFRIKMDGVMVEMEDRNKLGYNNYGVTNHGEILEYWNNADKMLWDTMIFGYKEPFNFYTKFKTKKLLGYIWTSTGNHKIILKLKDRGFGKKRFKEQLNTYIQNYKIINNMPDVKYVDLSKNT